MKKNLTRKLALSAAAMGVAALSVTTTTYAWFTSNSEATATAVKASTVDAGKGNILLSLDAKTWGKAATLEDKSSVKLAPVQYGTVDTTAGYYGLNGTTDLSGNTISYTLFVQVSNVAAGSTISMNLSNFAFSDKQTQKLLASAGTGAPAGTEVTVGLDDVLAMRVENVALPGDAIIPTGLTASEVAANNKHYRYLDENSSGADALAYYNNILGEGLTRPASGTFATTYESTALCTVTTGESSPTTTYNDITCLTLASDKRDAVFGIKLTFYIDGWDYQCFNAVAGTSITGGAINFKVTPPAQNSGN
jgi:hypothetical protein